MGEISDRRARKKAQTRLHIRTTAQRMFDTRGFDAVTVADIARAADVAVQTVFNHFPTKESLFFDGRLPWIDGPAEAVRNRAPGVSPLTALREHLVQGAGHFITLHTTPGDRVFAATVITCPALAAYEQQVVLAAEHRLTAALAAAWAVDPEPGAEELLSVSATIAPLTAAVWLAASRVVFVEQRRLAIESGDPTVDPAPVEALMDRVLAGLQAQVRLAGARMTTTHGSDRLPMPVPIRQAG